MKKITLLIVSVVVAVSLGAQGNSGGKGKDKQKDKEKTSKSGKQGNSKEKDNKVRDDDHDRKVWDGIGDNNCMKPSRNQPAKVRAAFQRDYPRANNVTWTKCRGDWTASFNGVFFRSTAVYHANGDRRDTRTHVDRDNIPRRVLDEILKRYPGGSRVDDAIKIEVPNVVKDIFRIKNVVDGKVRFDFFNSDGAPVTYNY
ncbi:MAG TPA: hypothetical protein VMZ03_13080 [Chitinophagaceae bacterium]|nr:hypothetical protein [Chitinophagaceae bacterium]